MELEDSSTFRGCLRVLEIDPIDDPDERHTEWDASRERSQDVAEERDSLTRVQLAGGDLFLRRRMVMVARPAARRFRTQWTSPQGDQTQRLSATSMIARGVVRGRPLFRPRMVISPLKPSGTPAASRRLAIGLKSGTSRGTLRGVARCDALMWVAPSCVVVSGLSHR